MGATPEIGSGTQLGSNHQEYEDLRALAGSNADRRGSGY